MDRVELVKTLEIVEQGLATNNLVPIFQCFCFQPGRVYAFNDTLGISAPCKIDISFAVHGKTLLGLLQHGSADKVTLELDDNDLVLKCGKSVSRLPYFPKRDFIFNHPTVEGPPQFSSIAELLEGLKICLTTASKDQAQAAIMGVTLHPNVMYSCDGDALTKVILTNPAKEGFQPQLLPNEFCSALLKIGTDGTLALIKDWAVSEFNGIWVYGRVLPNPNPFDYENLIQRTVKVAPNYVEVGDTLAAALRRAIVLAGPENAKTICEVSNNKLTLTTQTAMGVVRDVIPFAHPSTAGNVSAALMQRAIGVCTEMAIMPNCTAYRKGDTVIQLVSNM